MSTESASVNSSSEGITSPFYAGTNIQEVWQSAKAIMAAKALPRIIAEPRFASALENAVTRSLPSNNIDALLSIDLTVRLSNANKRLRPLAERILRPALQRPIPSLNLVTTGPLPADAKASEIRENVASALEWAEGDWLSSYIAESLLAEERSPRCREQLARQFALRLSTVDDWLQQLVLAEKNGAIIGKLDMESACVRLHDVLQALTVVMRLSQRSLTATARAGELLQELSQRAVPRSPNQQRPSKLSTTIVAIAEFLDAMILTNLGLLSEPRVYVVLETIHRWWAPATYSDDMRSSLEPVADKLTSAIRLIARAGAKSEKLARLLTSAVGDSEVAKTRLKKISDSEAGLSDDVQDWLVGRVRTPTTAIAAAAVDALRQRSEGDVDPLIGRLLLEAQQLELPSRPRDAADSALAKLLGSIEVLAKLRGVVISGERGELVDFSPSAHETISGGLPSESKVRIVRPMVVRKRQDGTLDILAKAIVEEQQL